MAVVLSKQLIFYPGVTVFTGVPALLELHDDNRLSLTKVDPATGIRSDVVLDVPLTELTVGGGSSTLTLIAGGKKTRVDFNRGSRWALAAGGIVGLAVAGALTADSGLGDWIKTFKAHGVTVKYWGMGKSIAIALGVVLFLFVIAVVLIGSGALNY